MLRYLFADVIAEEIKRDQQCRTQLLAIQNQQRLERANAPTEIQLPPAPTGNWNHGQPGSAAATPVVNGRPVATPGLAISLATPGIATHNSPALSRDVGSPIPEERAEADVNGDYFSKSNGITSGGIVTSPGLVATPGVASEEAKGNEENKEGTSLPKETPSKFGKAFRKNMSFSMKKLARTPTAEKEKIPEKKEKEDSESDTQSEKADESKNFDDNFFGAVQKIRLEYKEQLQAHSQRLLAQDAAGGALGAPPEVELDTLILPSLPTETPVLKPPANTTILIQEDRPEAGGNVDLYEGTVGSLAEHVDKIEKLAPMWLGDILLRNQLPVKEVVKISFVLDPWQDKLPPIAADG